jgi:hypothetical protein
MSLPEIILIIVSASFVVFIFGRMIYKRIKGMPSDECSSCKVNMKRAMKEAKKEVKKIKSMNGNI